MPKKNSFGKIAGIIALLTLLWSTFFVARLLFETAENNNQWFIPSNATLVVRIDGEQLIKQGFSDVVLTQKNTKLFNEIIAKLKDPESTNFGLNFKSDVYAFMIVSEGGDKIMGILANVIDHDQLTVDMDQFLGKHQGYGIMDDVTMILTKLDTSGSASTINLNKLATTYLSKKSSFDLSLLEVGNNNSELLQFWAEELAIPNHDIQLKNVSIALSILGDSLTLQGTAKHTAVAAEHISWISKESDFYLESAVIPDVLNNFLSDFLKSSGLNVPSISHININHRYTEHADEGNSILIPHFDATFAFTDSIEIDSTLQTAQNIDLITNLTESHFTYAGKQFYYQQTRVDQIYIGRNKPSKKSSIKGTLFEISGSLKPFSEFRGDGLVMKMLRMSDMYISCNELFSKIENVDISVKLKSKDTCSLDGVIVFNNGETPIDALLSFLFRSRLVD